MSKRRPINNKHLTLLVRMGMPVEMRYDAAKWMFVSDYYNVTLCPLTAHQFRRWKSVGWVFRLRPEE